MNEELTLGIITACLGIIVGFFGNYLIAKYNARNEIKKSISQSRAESFLELWKLCNRDIHTQKKQKKRHKRLDKWYSEGGGLLLPFKATDRFIGALKLLKKSASEELNEEQLGRVINDLSWLRTEMKYEVGSYTRKEADLILPNTMKRKRPS